MKTVTGRYIFWGVIIITVIDLANGDCLFFPDHAPSSWGGTKERVLQLIEEGQFVYLEPYRPLAPKKHIPPLDFMDQHIPKPDLIIQ